MNIVTNRFLLRDFEPDDGPAFIAWHADPRFQERYGPEISDPDHAERLLQMFRTWAGEQPRRKYQLAVARRGGPGTLIGCGGIRRSEEHEDVAEMGLELARPYWGRHGYAVEIADALLTFAFDALGIETVRGVTASNNARAIRLATWFGAEAADAPATADWMLARGWKQTAWALKREQWDARRMTAFP
jgi:RimJ/RimL family protein N-acetyltransferase